jgi:hypothetical protein
VRGVGAGGVSGIVGARMATAARAPRNVRGVRMVFTIIAEGAGGGRCRLVVPVQVVLVLVMGVVFVLMLRVWLREVMAVNVYLVLLMEACVVIVVCMVGACAYGIRGVGSVRGAVVVLKTSPPVRVHDASASALGEPSPCVSSGQAVQCKRETSAHVDGVLSPCEGE